MPSKRKRISECMDTNDNQQLILSTLSNELKCPICQNFRYGGILRLPCNEHYICYLCLHQNLQQNYDDNPSAETVLVFVCKQCKNDKKHTFVNSSNGSNASNQFPWKFHSVAFNAFLQSVLVLTQPSSSHSKHHHCQHSGCTFTTQSLVEFQGHILKCGLKHFKCARVNSQNIKCNRTFEFFNRYHYENECQTARCLKCQNKPKCIVDQTEKYMTQKSVLIGNINDLTQSIVKKTAEVKQVTKCGAAIQSITGLQIVKEILEDVDGTINTMPKSENYITMYESLRSNNIASQKTAIELAKIRLNEVCNTIDNKNTSLLHLRDQAEVHSKFEYLHYLYNAAASLKLLIPPIKNAKYIKDTAEIFEQLYYLHTNAAVVNEFIERNEEYQNGEIFNTARIDDQNGTTTIANNTYSDSDESPEYPHLV